MNSLIIPVYMNADDISALIATCSELSSKISDLEVIFVVDGSPDQSAALLRELLPVSDLSAQLIILSRNFGSYAAIRSGLMAAKGDQFAVMAADLQEPPELIVEFFSKLASGIYDVVVGTRDSRDDPFVSKIMSTIFWRLYRRFIVPDIPKGGVDVFACNQLFRDQLIRLDESHSSLVALIFWMGYRRAMVPYRRRARQRGRSSWTFKKKYTYFKDSIFSFTDVPIKALSWVGVLGILFSTVMSVIIIVGRISGWVNLPGYSATVLTIIFFGGIF